MEDFSEQSQSESTIVADGTIYFFVQGLITNILGLVFISIAAAYAETKGGADIITGFNREEAERFPDNSRKFLKNMNKTLRYATFEGNVKVVAPLIDCDKRQICKMAFDLKAPVELSVSCYIPIGFEGKKPIHCGSCESCMRRKRGFKEANVEDPTVYKSEEFI